MPDGFNGVLDAIMKYAFHRNDELEDRVNDISHRVTSVEKDNAIGFVFGLCAAGVAGYLLYKQNERINQLERAVSAQQSVLDDVVEIDDEEEAEVVEESE